MIIHAKDYILRNFNMSDAREFYQMTHDDDKIKTYVPSAYPNDPQEAYMMVNVYSKGDNINDFYLVIEKDNIMIGAIIAVRTIDMTLDTSAIIFKPYRGQGIMTVVLNQFKIWLKDHTDFEIMSLVIKKDNEASLRHVQKCGVILTKEDEENKFYKIYLKEGCTMAFNKSRNQCVVCEGGKWVKVTNNHVGKDVYDRKTNERIGTLIEPNPNTHMLQLRLINGKTVTIR